ncbi:hypothetical protein B0T16DRAFT_187390 [Cercophora newfieldiana]|uniref:Uncharacterized protein n=1 Tax=Cercophora newfieldiana TaxID=92897 RepID=A0AA40CLR5_9PEZI|nr:hypothetical protein B0T16DRAFT_187390 [Cercophora newfieldiana]
MGISLPFLSYFYMTIVAIGPSWSTENGNDHYLISLLFFFLWSRRITFLLDYSRYFSVLHTRIRIFHVPPTVPPLVLLRGEFWLTGRLPRLGEGYWIERSSVLVCRHHDLVGED